MALTKVSGSILKDPLNLGEVSIGGTLTYQDVTNIDSVGIITARSTIDAQGDVSIADKIIHTGDTNTAIRFPANDTISFETSGSERLRITSSGNVGIGSEIPAAKFVVSNAGANGFEFNPNFNSNNSIIASYNRSGGGSYSQLTLSASQIIFSQGGTEYGRFDSTGRFLIGVDTTTNNDSYVQSFKKTGNDATITVGNVATSASGLCRYDFAPSNKVVGSRIECHASEDFSTSANRTADLVFITRKDGTLSEKLRIDSDGRLIVGGGTHAGGSALVVKGGNQNSYSTIGMFSNHTNPTDGTLLSQIRFGSNESAVGADIRVYADAHWGSNDYPSRIEFYTTPDGSNSKQLRLQINKNGDIKIGNSAPGPSLSSSPTMIRYFGKKVMQGTLTSTTTLNGSGAGTFELGKIWNADDTSIELFITVSRSDSSAYTTSYCKAFCQKVRGTGITDGYILRQDTAAAGFTFNSITSGGYSGTPSHGARVNVSGGVANQGYTLTCFYTAISKNDFY